MIDICELGRQHDPNRAPFFFEDRLTVLLCVDPREATEYIWDWYIKNRIEDDEYNLLYEIFLGRQYK